MLEGKEAEALVILMEECAEVSQEASKCIRFGVTEENAMRLEQEVADLLTMIDILKNMSVINLKDADLFAEKKIQKLRKYSNIFRD